MKSSHRQLMLASAAALIVAAQPMAGRAEEGAKVNQASQVDAIPTPEEARAALMTPIPKQPSAGNDSGLSTTGTGAAGNQSGEPPPSGPIGATGQTIPAKFSKRNDILDRVPIMAFPLALTDQNRQRIYESVMADKSSPVAGAEKLSPASSLSADQAMNDMHPLPDGLRDIVQVQGYKYIKAKDKVLLVQPSTRIVVDEIKR